MDPPVPPTRSVIDGDEDWELYNEDGFVYKRKKRRRIAEETGARETSKPPFPELDPVVKERILRIRKQRILVKLKRKYQSEIEQWEILANSLNVMQDKADRFQASQREERFNANEMTSTCSYTEGACEFGGEDASVPSSMLDGLLFMAERQESIIQEVSNMCEVAENICRMGEEEEEKKQWFFKLAIWRSSPTDLMASLCAD